MLGCCAPECGGEVGGCRSGRGAEGAEVAVEGGEGWGAEGGRCGDWGVGGEVGGGEGVGDVGVEGGEGGGREGGEEVLPWGGGEGVGGEECEWGVEGVAFWCCCEERGDFGGGEVGV